MLRAQNPSAWLVSIPLLAASSENFTAIGALAEICFRIDSARAMRLARGQLRDEADAIGFLGRDRFAGEDQLQRTPLADQARQALRAATAGQQPELHLGLPELGMFHGDSHRAGHRRLAGRRQAQNH